jgi:hypothetical protein
VPGGTSEQRIPADLGVVVRVRIDKPRSQDETVGVHGSLCRRKENRLSLTGVSPGVPGETTVVVARIYSKP